MGSVLVPVLRVEADKNPNPSLLLEDLPKASVVSLRTDDQVVIAIRSMRSFLRLRVTFCSFKLEYLSYFVSFVLVLQSA